MKVSHGTPPTRARAFAPYLTLAAVFVTASTLIFVALYRANGHFPPLLVGYFADSGRPAALHHDTGYGFNDLQREPVQPSPGAFSRTPGSDFAEGPVEVAFVFASAGAHDRVTRLDSKGEVRESGPAVTHRITPVERLACFEVRDWPGLRAVRVSTAGKAVEAAMASSDIPHGMILFDRSEGELRLAGSVFVSPLPPAGACGIQVRGEMASTWAVAVISGQGRVLRTRLVREETLPDALSVCNLDLAELRVHAHPVRNTIQGLLALLLGGGFAWLVGRATACGGPLRAVVAGGGFLRRHAGVLLLVGMFAGYYGLWACAFWPGLLMSDSIAPVLQTHTLQFDTRLSCFYTLFVMALMQLGGPGALVLFQVIATALLASAITLYCWRRGPWFVTLPLAVVFLLSPVICSYVVFHQRGVLNGLLTCTILFLLFRLCHETREKDPLLARRARVGGVVLLLGLLLFALLLRPDNVALAVAAVMVLFLFRVVPWPRLATLTVGFTVLAALASGPLERVLVPHAQDANRYYLLTSLVNPMGALVVRGYWTATPEQDGAIIDRIIPREVFRKHWHPAHDGVYWGYCPGKRYSREDVAAFRRLLVRAAVQNPGVVLGARAETFFTALMGPGQLTVTAPTTEHDPPGMRRLYRDLGLERVRVQNEALFTALGRMVRDSLNPQRGLSRFWNAGPQLAVVLLVLLLSRWLPVSAAVSLVLLARLAVVFAAAPGSYFHYIYDLYLFGLCLVPLAAVEWRARFSFSPGGAAVNRG
ncbi:MAG: hypothetical protein L0Z62_22795 [Gemmataceae bacterium]|nr:hypothetical protein [Gemmataceae bacterium]